MKTNWQTKKLGDLCDLITKGTTPTSVGFEFISSGINFIKIESISTDGIFKPSKFAFISEECHKALNRSQLEENDILFSIAGALGRTALVNKEIIPANTNQALAIVRLKKTDEVFINFVLLALNSGFILEQIKNVKGGVAQQNLSLTQIRDFQIPLPPLPEQHRIVAILDKAFDKIAKAKANAEKNLKNAKELFESYLNGVFEKGGDDWEYKKLIDMTSKIGSGATPRGGKASYQSKGISLIRSMNVHDRIFKVKNLAFISEKQANDLSNVTLEEEDILLNITGASVARSCIVLAKYLPARVNQHVSIIRVKNNIINPYLINYLLTSKLYKNKLLGIGEQGATRQAITKAQLENFMIRFPKSLDEQKQIVTKLDALSTETKNLESIYKQKLADLEELKKSILHKAFAGEL